jgi:hypothetical protein
MTLYECYLLGVRARILRLSWQDIDQIVIPTDPASNWAFTLGLAHGAPDCEIMSPLAFDGQVPAQSERDMHEIKQTLDKLRIHPDLCVVDRVRELALDWLRAKDPDHNPSEIVPTAGQVASTVASLLRGTDLPQGLTLSEAVVFLAKHEITPLVLSEVIWNALVPPPKTAWADANGPVRAMNLDQGRGVFLHLLWGLFGITVPPTDYHALNAKS